MAQHLLWLLGHPGTWVTLFAWLLCCLGAVKLGRLIKRQYGSPALSAYILVVLSLLGLYAFILNEAYRTFVEGAAFPEHLMLLPWMSMVVNVLALASAIWIAADLFARKRR